MILLIRFLLFIALLWGIWKLINYIVYASSTTVDCPRCDGRGSWQGTRERVQCKQCAGTGRIPRDLVR